MNKKRLSNVAVDAVFDSVSIATTYKEKLAEHGVIFCSISEAISEYPDLIEKYMGTVVPINDNFFCGSKFCSFLVTVRLFTYPKVSNVQWNYHLILE